jgi:oxygen-independent coproporphyrinogen-3 oxidase
LTSIKEAPAHRLQIRRMWPYHPELLTNAVPRYTSYPTAAEFRESVAAADYVAALKALQPGTRISLYVHVPFCREICWYCGCNTGRSNKSERVAAYLEALESEIDWLARQIGGKVELGRISFGGGSPNALDPLGFVRLVSQILTAFGASAPEISVELDPRALDAEWAGLLGKVGATRASLGVQTLEPHVQQKIGRIQPLAMIQSAVAMLRDSGVSSLNFDLMYGLPAQSADDLARTLDQALALAPDRVALFGYAHVPTMIPRQRRIEAEALPGLADHFAHPADPLARAAREGRLKRNFQGFTDDQADVLLGVGASSISCLPDLIVQNEKNAGRYRMRVLAEQSAAACGVRRSPEDQERGLVIEDLLCGREADLSGLPQDHWSEARLQPFLEAGLCHLDDDRLCITPNGLPYARAVAACFDSYRGTGPGRFSSAV